MGSNFVLGDAGRDGGRGALVCVEAPAPIVLSLYRCMRFFGSF